MRTRSIFALVVPLTGLLTSPLAVPGARGQTRAPDQVVVTAAPLGKFGFGTGYGGPIWRSTLGHLVILSVQAGGPADRAGLHQGDEILAVNGLTVPGRARSEVFAALRAIDARQIVTFRVAPEKGGAPARDVRVVAGERS